MVGVAFADKKEAFLHRPHKKIKTKRQVRMRKKKKMRNIGYASNKLNIIYTLHVEYISMNTKKLQSLRIIRHHLFT